VSQEPTGLTPTASGGERGEGETMLARIVNDPVPSLVGREEIAPDKRTQRGTH
jgi:hypothetical protein